MIDKKKETIETYNKNAKEMVKRFGGIGPRTNDIEIAFSYITKKKPRVFEIGCGNGRDAKEIIKHTPHYLGIDIAEKLIEIAKEYVPEGKFVVADLETFNFPKRLDIIFSFASLIHSNKEVLKEVFKKSYNSLNKGGIFFVSLKLGTGEKTKTDKFGKRTYYHYTPEDIKKIAKKKFKVLYEDQQKVFSSIWFTIVLQKI